MPRNRAPSGSPNAGMPHPTMPAVKTVLAGISNWKRLQWGRHAWVNQDSHNMAWQNTGVLTCDCSNYRTSQMACIQAVGSATMPAGYRPHCEHVVNFHLKVNGGFLVDRLNVFNDDGDFVSSHGWSFEVDEARDVLPMTVFFFRKKPSGSHTVLSWEVGLTPVVEARGALWNVYFQRDSLWASGSGLLCVAAYSEDLLPHHIGFYDTSQPLLAIAQLTSSSFVDIALCSPCASCSEVINPDHLKQPSGRWDAIYRGHYMETHKGVGPCCDNSDLIPFVAS